jgi:PPOX class probable F420-dependent enzyme
MVAHMDFSKALEFALPLRNGVLTTQKRDGRPQLSNITYHLDTDDVFRISVTATRAKYHNMVRDPRVSLHVARPDFWAYAVFEGDADLSPIAADPHDDTVEELVALYRSIGGEHPDWDQYRTAMVNDRRLVVRLRPTHVYGMVPG